MDRIPLDLNKLLGDELPGPHPSGGVSGNVEVILRDHKAKLLELFAEARASNLVCVGALYRLTDSEVLEAMATVATSVVVQKEKNWWAGKDLAPRAGWKDLLRVDYDAVAASGEHNDLFQRQNCPEPLGSRGLLEDQHLAGIRCFGQINPGGAGNEPSPILHDKFLVFAELNFMPEPGPQDAVYTNGEVEWKSRVVWIGSYNPSRMANRSLETTLIIRDERIATLLLHKWACIMALSEPLDTTAESIQPQWDERT